MNRKRDTAIGLLPPRRVAYLSFLLLFGSARFLSAQYSKAPTPPPDPVLARAPERAEWTISMHYDRGDSLAEKEQGSEVARKGPQDLQPVSIRVTKDGAIYREIMRRGDGTESEKWISDGLQVRTGPNGRIVRIMPPSTFYAPDYSDYARSDFETAEWVERANFSGVRVYRGTDVYVFETTAAKHRLTPREAADRANGSLPEAARDPARKLTLYLDMKTRLPLLIDDGEVVSTYEYLEGAPPALVLPPKFSEAISRWKKDILRKTSVPLPP